MNMKNYMIYFIVITALVLASCASASEEVATAPVSEVEVAAAEPTEIVTLNEAVEIIDGTELTVERIEARPVISTRTDISFAFEVPRLSAQNQVLIISTLQPLLPVDPQVLVQYYFDEAEIEGINTDLAIAQMIYNTNELKYGGLFAINNPGGLGMENNARSRQKFDTLQMGVRAHIQHLKGYASSSDLRTNVVDSRRSILITEDFLGNVGTLGQLFFTWYDYEGVAEKVIDILNRQYTSVL